MQCRSGKVGTQLSRANCFYSGSQALKGLHTASQALSLRLQALRSLRAEGSRRRVEVHRHRVRWKSARGGPAASKAPRLLDEPSRAVREIAVGPPPQEAAATAVRAAAKALRALVVCSAVPEPRPRPRALAIGHSAVRAPHLLDPMRIRAHAGGLVLPALLLGLLATGAQAQHEPRLFGISAEQTCPISDLRARATALDEACWRGGADIPSTCSAMCAAVWGEMQRDCAATFAVAFDQMDGSADGAAVPSLQTACDAVTATDIVAELASMQSAGCQLSLDGVGEVGVDDLCTGQADATTAGAPASCAGTATPSTDVVAPTCTGIADPTADAQSAACTGQADVTTAGVASTCTGTASEVAGAAPVCSGSATPTTDGAAPSCTGTATPTADAQPAACSGTASPSTAAAAATCTGTSTDVTTAAAAAACTGTASEFVGTAATYSCSGDDDGSGAAAVCSGADDGSGVAATCAGSDDGSGAAAACPGADDGTGVACALSADSSACAVQGGDCSYAAAAAGAACALSADSSACAVQGGDCSYAAATAGAACVLSGDSTACAVQGGDCSYLAATAGAACVLSGDSTECAVQGGDCSYTSVDAVAAYTPSCDLDAATDGTDSCPGGCTMSDAVAEVLRACDVDPVTDGTPACGGGCTATDTVAEVIPVCDLDASTDGTDSCPAGCTSVDAVAASAPTCDLDAGSDGTDVCPAGCTMNDAVAEVIPVCDLDAGTDDTDACPAGCTSIDAVAGSTPTCDLDAATDGMDTCPAGCTMNDAVAEVIPVCDLDASTDGTDTCAAGCATVDAMGESAPPTCDLDASTDGTDACPAGCTLIDAVAEVIPVCDLDASTDGTDTCPAGCATVGAVAAFTPTCDLDASTDGTDACPAGCGTTDAIAEVRPICDLDASTDGSDACPTGCASVAEVAAQTPTCDLDASTDGTDACPAGCGTTDAIAEVRPTCDLDASTDGSDACLGGCTMVDAIAEVRPTCDLDAGTDGSDACPAGCATSGAVVSASSSCLDTGPASRCGLVSLGVLTCEDDFCADCGRHASECDRTCGFCNAGHRRRELQIQLGGVTCDLQERVAPVNGACCEDAASCAGGAAGVPTVCDAKCAVTYLPFWNDCELEIRGSFIDAPSTIAAFGNLATACRSMPKEMLLPTLSSALSCSVDASQTETGLGPWLDTSIDCALDAFLAKTSAVDEACCTADSDDYGCAQGVPLACTAMCGAKLIDLQSTCAATMNHFFSSTQLAGMSSFFQDTCLTIPTREVFHEIERLEADGCTVILDGVAESAVPTQAQDGCSNSGPAHLCQLVDEGILSCEADFCPGTCSHSRECDLTCGFCHRRAQMSLVIHTSQDCGPQQFADRTAAVDLACCANAECTGGVPNSCDAACAPVFDLYYKECHGQLMAMADRDLTMSLHQLSETCAQLPIEPMLVAINTALCPDTGAGVACPEMASLFDGATGDKEFVGACSGAAGDVCTVNCIAGTVNSHPGDYTCNVVGGWEDLNSNAPAVSCTDFDECLSTPCQNGAVCADSIHDSSPGVALDAFQCTCVAGFFGDLCDAEVDECASAPCANQASCTDGTDTFACSCTSGYTGDLCDADTDECASSPCLNSGACADSTTDQHAVPLDAYACACVAPFEGENCDSQTDNCAVVPCQNDAACTSDAAGFTCSCAAGFTDDTCATETDECASGPCQNSGVCSTSAVAAYLCECVAGFLGENCDASADNCLSSPCQNAGVCTTTVTEFMCACTSTGYTGALCETADPCATANPCLNNGACDGSRGTAVCTCTLGWYGDLCDADTDECVSGPCSNGGTCTDGENSYTCACEPTHAGDNCENVANPCSPTDPCQNGGACSTCGDADDACSPGSAVCACASGFFGDLCETNVDECTPDPCQNGGVCTDDVNAFTCACPETYSGLMCQCDPTMITVNDGSACEACVDGKTPNDGRYACQDCPAGSAGTGGICTTCQAGTKSEPPTLSTSCVACAANEAGTDGSCGMCQAGTFAAADHLSCPPCPSGQVRGSTEATGQCSACDAGTEPNGAQSDCVDCPIGKAGNDGTCTTCAAGTEGRGPPHTDACEPCAGDTYSPDGASCVQCATGQIAADDHVSCVHAPAPPPGEQAAASCTLTGADFCLLLTDLALSTPLDAKELQTFEEDGSFEFADGLVYDCDGSVVASCDSTYVQDLVSDSIVIPPPLADGLAFTVEFAVTSIEECNALLELFVAELGDPTSTLLADSTDTPVMSHLATAQTVNSQCIEATAAGTSGGH